MTMKKISNDTRNKSIIIRLSQKENKTLRNMADKSKMNLSSYIRDKALSEIDSLYDKIPHQVDIWYLVNDIYHETMKCSDQKAKDRIISIIRQYMNTHAEVQNEEKQN